MTPTMQQITIDVMLQNKPLVKIKDALHAIDSVETTLKTIKIKEYIQCSEFTKIKK